MQGLLLVDKPAGPSSRGVVDAVGRVLGRRDLGHAGTLDPGASGLLVLAVGHATRWLPYLPDAKRYRATVRLGLATDSEDVWGAPVEVLPAGFRPPDPAAFAAALKALEGIDRQVVPMVSAVKVGGRRLYQMAREGVIVERPERPVRVDAVRVIEVRGPDAVFEVDCGPGTYVRSLCVEVGRRLGLPACMAELRRLAAGGFSVEAALPPERWTAEALAAALVGPERALAHLPLRELDADEARDVRHGRPVPGGAGDGGTWRLNAEGRLLALALDGPQGLRPKRVFGD